MPADDILALAHQAGQSNPLMGWDWFAANTSFHTEMMREAGRIGPNLIECVGCNLVQCLAAVGLKREDVVEVWRQGKDQAIADAKAAKTAEGAAKIKGKDAARAEELATAEKAKPVMPSAAPETPKEPALKPVPCRTDAVKEKVASKARAKPVKGAGALKEQPTLF